MAGRLTDPRRTFGILSILAALTGVLLAVSVVHAGHRNHRLAEHAVVVDAEILDSDLGCITATGGSSSVGGPTITYRVRFPLDDGRLHTTSVVRPCTVIPPDFGRGRGSIWVEYDRDDPDRIRVLNDRSLIARMQILSVLTGIALAVSVGCLIGYRRTSRTPS